MPHILTWNKEEPEPVYRLFPLKFLWRKSVTPPFPTKLPARSWRSCSASVKKQPKTSGQCVYKPIYRILNPSLRDHLQKNKRQFGMNTDHKELICRSSINTHETHKLTTQQALGGDLTSQPVEQTDTTVPSIKLQQVLTDYGWETLAAPKPRGNQLLPVRLLWQTSGWLRRSTVSSVSTYLARRLARLPVSSGHMITCSLDIGRRQYTYYPAFVTAYLHVTKNRK